MSLTDDVSNRASFFTDACRESGETDSYRCPRNDTQNIERYFYGQKYDEQ